MGSLPLDWVENVGYGCVRAHAGHVACTGTHAWLALRMCARDLSLRLGGSLWISRMPGITPHQQSSKAGGAICVREGAGTGTGTELNKAGLIGHHSKGTRPA